MKIPSTQVMMTFRFSEPLPSNLTKRSSKVRVPKKRMFNLFKSLKMLKIIKELRNIKK